MRQRGFTLVEVAVAVAVLTIALVGLFSLMPSGISNFRRAMDTSVSAQIAQRILQDAQQSEFDQLVDRAHLPADLEKKGYCPERFSFRAPAVHAPQWRYFDEQGTEIRPRSDKGKLSEEEKQAIVYQVNTRIRPRAELPTFGESGGQVAQITVQIARNPGAMAKLPIVESSDSPEHNLISPKTAVPVFTYSALVGKNQGQ